MYLSFFGLTEKPFAITPDPRYLYLSARHADALAHLVYGINEAGGFIQLTGEVGTGKTTTIRSLLARAPKNAEIALILNPRLSAAEFLRSLCEELGLGVADSPDGQSKDLVDALNRYLLRMHAAGRRVVLIVDEAQDLAPDVLEQVRLLTNLETETQKLLQIILIGQPELRALLAREDLRQLAQRVTGRYHLDPLSADETAAYVRHRLRVAGATNEIFSRGALRAVYRLSNGIPRVINILCDRALLGSYTQDLHEVSAAMVRRAAREVFGAGAAPRWLPLAVGLGAAAVLAASSWALWRHEPRLFTLRAAHTVSPAHPSRVASAAPSTRTNTLRAAATTAGAASAAAVARPDPVAARTGPALADTTAAAGDGQGLSTLAALLPASRSVTDTDSAFRSLFSLWNAHYVPGSLDGCSQAVSQGLQCLMQRGSLAQLRQLNRPAILMLSDDTGTPYQVVLRGLGDDQAQLQIGARTALISVADLTRYWFGDFVLLWHPATPDAGGLHLGMRGPAVRRLREQLERWGGLPADGSDQYDEPLMRLVEQFQHAHRLTVDGIAGIETQVVLDAALAAPGSPLLQAQAQSPPTPIAARGG